MAIGFISDTHGAYEDTKKALELLKDCEVIIHLGDVLYHGPRNNLPVDYDTAKLAELLKAQDNIVYVRGNCDSDVDQMVIEKDLSNRLGIFNFEDLRIFAVHGYEETEEERFYQADFYVADIVASGHTHKKVLDGFKGRLILNPGSVAIPKDGIKSVARIRDRVAELLDLETGEVLDAVKLDEIEKEEGMIEDQNFFVGELF